MTPNTHCSQIDEVGFCSPSCKCRTAIKDETGSILFYTCYKKIEIAVSDTRTQLPTSPDALDEVTSRITDFYQSLVRQRCGVLRYDATVSLQVIDTEMTKLKNEIEQLRQQHPSVSPDALEELLQYCNDERDFCDHEGDTHENYSTAMGYYARVHQCDRIIEKIHTLRQQQPLEHQR